MLMQRNTVRACPIAVAIRLPDALSRDIYMTMSNIMGIDIRDYYYNELEREDGSVLP